MNITLDQNANKKYLKSNVVGYTSQVVINVVRVNSVLILTTKSCNVVIVLANFISNSVLKEYRSAISLSATSPLHNPFKGSRWPCTMVDVAAQQAD